MIKIGDKVYYGYSKNLNEVKTANLRNLSYLTKELLVQVNNESHLNDNLVFRNKPPKYLMINRIIKTYIIGVNEEGETLAFGGVKQRIYPVYRQPHTGVVARILENIENQTERYSD